MQSGADGHRLPATVAAILVTLALGGDSHAHVAPSVDTNNRYIKISAMPDRIRMVYTVYIGEIPGAQARRRMDTDRDGILSHAEASAYGTDTAEAVAQALSIELDGAPVAITWTEMDVGLGTPATDSGAFSVDLVAWLCIDGAALARTHSLSLFDHFKLSRPGETELRVEATPGITIDKSTLGADGSHSQLDFKWLGGGGPTSKLGFFLRYTVDSDVAIANSKCPPEIGAAGGAATELRAKTKSPRSRKAVTAIAIATAVLILLGLLWWRRRVANGASRK